jgi:hypothetical protein
MVLPPVHKSEEWSGTLVRRYYDPELGYIAQAFKGKGSSRNSTDSARDG